MSALSQFSNLSSWRKQVVSINGNETYAVTFMDTMPNQFYLVNPNNSTLKIGIGSLPTSDKYEHRIEPNTSEVFGRPEGTAKVYILNDSPTDITVTLFSVNKEFDASILKNMNVAISSDLKIDSDLIIKGIAEGLELPVKTLSPLYVATQNSTLSVKDTNSSSFLTLFQNALKTLGSTYTSSNGSLTELLNDIKSNTNIKSWLTSFNGVLSQIANNTSAFDLTGETINVNFDMSALKRVVYGFDKHEAIHYYNNVVTIEERFTDLPSKQDDVDIEYVIIPWIVNDSDKTLNINKKFYLRNYGKTGFTDIDGVEYGETVYTGTVLTVLPNERIENVCIRIKPLNEDEWDWNAFSIEGEEIIFRCSAYGINKQGEIVSIFNYHDEHFSEVE